MKPKITVVSDIVYQLSFSLKLYYYLLYRNLINPTDVPHAFINTTFDHSIWKIKSAMCCIDMRHDEYAYAFSVFSHYSNYIDE